MPDLRRFRVQSLPVAPKFNHICGVTVNSEAAPDLGFASDTGASAASLRRIGPEASFAIAERFTLPG